MKNSALDGFILCCVIGLSILVPTSVSSQCRNQNDYTALRALYLSTDGNQWVGKFGWPNSPYFNAFPLIRPDVDMSDWSGIVCASGRVVALDLSHYRLKDTLPQELELLTSITTLNLSDNQIAYASYESLSGLTEMTELDLSRNQLQGDISVLSSLPKLSRLHINHNVYDGAVPESILSMSGLIELNIQNNRFSGALSDTIKQMTSLRVLNAGFNNLSGEIPEELGHLNSLNILNLSHNKLSGTLHESLFTLPELHTIHLTNNNLSGCLPESAKAFCPNGKVLDVSENCMLPWSGDFTRYCQTDGSIVSQVGAYCQNFNPSDGIQDVIKANCMCGDSISLPNRKAIRGRIFIDNDRDGIFGGSDIPIKDVRMALYPDCDMLATPLMATSGTDGVYEFTNLPFPPRQWYLSFSEDNDLQCDGGIADCIDWDKCDVEDRIIDFPCAIPDCVSNPYSVDNICQSAFDNPFCDLRVIGQWPCGQNPSDLGPWANQAHCGGVFHNTSFFGFVAGHGDYEINFTIFNCAGIGVQYGVYEACDPQAGPICNGFSNSGTVTIPSDELIPCRTYVFWIDGKGGSVCNYYTFVTGDWNNCSLPPVADIVFSDTSLNIDSIICKSSEPRTLQYVPDHTEFIIPLESMSEVRFLWSLTSPDGRHIDHITYGSNGVFQDMVFSMEGTYEVCLKAFHPCNSRFDIFCKTIEVASIPNVDTLIILCDDAFPWNGALDSSGYLLDDPYGNPWQWRDGEIGLWQYQLQPDKVFLSEYKNTQGCSYHQMIRFMVEEKPNPPIIRCESTTINEVIFRWDDIEGAIDYEIEMGDPSLKAEKIGITGWRVFDLEEDTHVEIRVRALLEGPCQHTDYAYHSCISRSCPHITVVIDLPELFCKSDDSESVFLTDSILSYPGFYDVKGDFAWRLVGEENTISVTELDIQNITEGDYILSYHYYYIVNQDTCRQVTNKSIKIREKPTANFSLDTSGCILDSVFIRYLGNHKVSDFIWDFGSDFNYKNLGQGLFVVQWTQPGEKSVQLTTLYEGCFSLPYSQDVIVEDIPSIQEITCDNATLDSIHFVWGSSPCAQNFNVFVSGVEQPQQTDTFFTFYEVVLDEEVEIVVIPNSLCACDFEPLKTSCSVMSSSLNGTPGLIWKVYPNPALNSIRLIGPAIPDVVIYSIQDVMGKVVASGRLSESIDISGLPQGLYLLQWEYNSHPVRAKFLKQ